MSEEKETKIMRSFGNEQALEALGATVRIIIHDRPSSDELVAKIAKELGIKATDPGAALAKVYGFLRVLERPLQSVTNIDYVLQDSVNDAAAEAGVAGVEHG